MSTHITQSILAEVKAERDRQDRMFNPPPRPDHTPTDWLAILAEEFGEASQEAVEVRWAQTEMIRNDRLLRLRTELVQVAAVAVAFVEQIDLS